MNKKKQTLRDEDTKRPVSEYQYLMQYLSTEPSYAHEGYQFALRSKDGSYVFIHNAEHRPPYYVAHLNDLARALNMKLVSIKGTWSWEPDLESEVEEDVDVPEVIYQKRKSGE